MRRLWWMLALPVVSAGLLAQPADDQWLTWSERTVRQIGRSARVTGRVGGFWGIRGLHTERAQNYELRATWLTPEVLRASARFTQLRHRRSVNDARRLLEEAERAAETIVMVELDPREGSGVIPLDWTAYLQPMGAAPDSGRAVDGTLIEDARKNPVLVGVEKRDYDFDVFWVGFPLHDREGRFVLEGSTHAELIVRIHSSEGRVSWPIPHSIRRSASEPSDAPSPRRD